MYSFAARLNTLCTVTLTALAACAGVMAATSLLHEGYLAPSVCNGTITAKPTQLIALDHPHPLMPQKTRAIERMVVFLDVDADFTPAFNWNTKQVYVYAVAHYKNKKMRRNEVTLWDTVITDKANARLQLPRVADYYFDDFAQNLRGRNVTVRLWYHIMCHSGVTFTREIESAAAKFVAK